MLLFQFGEPQVQIGKLFCSEIQVKTFGQKTVISNVILRIAVWDFGLIVTMTTWDLLNLGKGFVFFWFPPPKEGT